MNETEQNVPSNDLELKGRNIRLKIRNTYEI